MVKKESDLVVASDQLGWIKYFRNSWSHEISPNVSRAKWRRRKRKKKKHPLSSRKRQKRQNPYEKNLHDSYKAIIYIPYLNRSELHSMFHVSPIHVWCKIRPIMATFILKSTHTTCRGFLGSYINTVWSLIWVLHDNSVQICMVLVKNKGNY